MAQKRYNPKHHEIHLQQKLKRNLIAMIIIPLAVLIAFILFGPKIGVLFGLVSVNRGQNGDTMVKPTPPIFRNAPKATNSNTISLNGFSEPGTVVRLFVNGPQTHETITTNDGIFSFENVTLIEGRNTIHAKATNQQGLESDSSQSINIEMDTKSPEIEITSPKDEEVIRNLNERVNIQGKLNEKATVRVNERLAVLRPDFTFEILLGIKEGINEIKIEATDEAGNVTVEELSVQYIRQSGQ